MFSNADSQTYYEILGVDPDADAKTIRKAYLKLSLKYHPDKNPNNVEEAKAMFVKIGEANDVLSDPDKRVQYNQFLATGEQHGVPSSSAGRTEERPIPTAEQYESYREAFDATFSNLSEDELRDLMGAAAMMGSVVGGFIGARMMRNKAGGPAQGTARSTLMANAGSLIGSMMASEAASSLVKTAHEQSRERALKDADRRERIARGEKAGTSAFATSDQAMKELFRTTANSLKTKTMGAFVNAMKRKSTEGGSHSIPY